MRDYRGLQFKSDTVKLFKELQAQYAAESVTGANNDQFMRLLLQKWCNDTGAVNWYNRFRDELPFGADWKGAVEAAKRAAGIEESA